FSSLVHFCHTNSYKTTFRFTTQAKVKLIVVVLRLSNCDSNTGRKKNKSKKQFHGDTINCKVPMKKI
ncbi:hypothetical protein, partial [Enterobacter cloacae complex sp. 2DZ2F20B]|uniref:hypothetical protein n=1 Tax=Enterobacter cloacae complex sp. 2DZ2F20B TaxID=2511993 RepID=UPI001CA4D2E0